MFKKILRMAMTFVVLTAAYSGYSRGFALLAGRVAQVRNVPILPTDRHAVEVLAGGDRPGRRRLRAGALGRQCADAVLRHQPRLLDLLARAGAAG